MQEKNIMVNIIKIETESRTSGTDVSNLGDNSTMTVRTTDGKEIELHLYGR